MTAILVFYLHSMSFAVCDNVTIKTANLIKLHECKLIRLTLWWCIDVYAVQHNFLCQVVVCAGNI